MATLSRIVVDRLGQEVMIVHPDFDSQLNDPAFAPSGTQQYDVPYRGWTTPRDFLVLLQQKIAAAGRTTLASLIQKRIDLIDEILQMDADYTLWQTRLSQWPTPTQAQQTLINAARLQYLQDLSNIQATRDSINTIISQIP